MHEILFSNQLERVEAVEEGFSRVCIWLSFVLFQFKILLGPVYMVVYDYFKGEEAVEALMYFTFTIVILF